MHLLNDGYYYYISFEMNVYQNVAFKHLRINRICYLTLHWRIWHLKYLMSDQITSLQIYFLMVSSHSQYFNYKKIPEIF